MFIEQFSSMLLPIALIIFTVCAYVACAHLQLRFKIAWINPLLFSISIISAFILYIDMPFNEYYEHTKILTYLIEPAVVVLGYPLYQHLKNIKNQLNTLILLLSLGVLIVIPVSIILTMWIINTPELAVSLALKSVTTPIGLSLTEALNGNGSLTAFAIILAGTFGAILGPPWLNFINVKSAEAQGAAIGAASHSLGTATISKISYQHSAYGSISLILSAVITAIISPFLIPFILNYLM